MLQFKKELQTNLKLFSGLNNYRICFFISITTLFLLFFIELHQLTQNKAVPNRKSATITIKTNQNY